MELLQYERKIQFIGKSYLITLPKAWCRSHDVNVGSRLYINVKENGELILRVKK